MDNGSHDGGSGNVGFHSYRRSPRPISAPAPAPSSGMLPSIYFTLTNTLYNTFSLYIYGRYIHEFLYLIYSIELSLTIQIYLTR